MLILVNGCGLSQDWLRECHADAWAVGKLLVSRRKTVPISIASLFVLA